MSLIDRRRRRKPFVVPKLMITSMMDMFTIILIFLLFSFSDNPEKIQLEHDLELPHSSAEEDYNDSLRLILSQGTLMLDGEVLATVNGEQLEGLDPNQLKKSELYRRLITLRALSENNKDTPADGTEFRQEEKKNQILFLCDKKHSFKIINPVIKTAGLAGFPNFQFAVLKE